MIVSLYEVPSSILQVVNNMFQICSNHFEQAARRALVLTTFDHGIMEYSMFLLVKVFLPLQKIYWVSQKKVSLFDLL